MTDEVIEQKDFTVEASTAAETPVMPEKKKRARRKKQPSLNVEDQPKRPSISDTLEAKSYASLEDLDAMPLDTHEDYIKYNEAVRRRRKVLRKKDVDFLYAPIDLVKCYKCRVTRTSNRGQPININLKSLENAVWFQAPKGGYKDGEEIMIPACIIDKINGLAEPKYKQVVYPDGSYETVLDYMDNKYSCQIIPG